MVKCLFLAVTLGLTIGFPVGAWQEASLELAAECRQLVEQLGSPSFTTRESASERLSELGLSAKSALEANLQHKDLEVRLRVRQLLVRAMRDDFERRLAAFLDGNDATRDHELPGWGPFSKAVGHHLPARQLFVEMIRHESDLLVSLELPPDERGRILGERAQFLQSLTANSGGLPTSIHPASIGTLLFVGAETPSAGGVLSSRLYIMLNNANHKQFLMAGQHGVLLRQLLDRWIVARAETAQDDFGLQLALSYDLEQTALAVARKCLDGPAESIRGIPHAAIAVGRFGKRDDDYARLLRHVQNKSVCHTWSNPQLKKDGVIEIQVRDVVLVMLLHLTDQDPKEYGFNLLQPNPSTMYQIYTFGFLESDQREAAHAKWEERRRADDGERRTEK